MERRAWYKERHQARVAEAKQDKRQIKSTKQCFCFLWKGKTEQDRTETEQQLHRNPNRRIKTKQLTTTKTTKHSSSFLPSLFCFFRLLETKNKSSIFWYTLRTENIYIDCSVFPLFSSYCFLSPFFLCYLIFFVIQKSFEHYYL